MDSLTTAARAAERLLDEKETLARRITSGLYERMPHLTRKYGEYGRIKCLEDMRYNIEHLAPAVHLEAPEMFAGYVRWLDELLRARDVATDELFVALEVTRDLARECFAADEAGEIDGVIEAGLAALAKDVRT